MTNSFVVRLGVVAAAIAFASCSVSVTPDQPMALKVEDHFAAAGNIEIQLEGGDYTIRAGSGENIRVSFGGNVGNATSELTVNGARANLAIKNTPSKNFKATLEVPETVDLTVHLTGGNLEIAALKGNKNIDSKAGNVEISTPSATEYSSVDASVTAGNLEAGPFGQSSSGIAAHLKWAGSGKYTLHASLGAGNLELKR